MVFSRPKRSDTRPNRGRVSPFVKRSIVSASGSAARPNTSTLLTPKSAAKVAICEVTISPEMDMIVIMRNISQNSGVRSVRDGGMSGTLRPSANCRDRTGGGVRRPCAAIKPTIANTRPNIHSVASSPRVCNEAEIGNVVTIGPMPYPAATAPAAEPHRSGNHRTISPTTPT
jgi:hypothetical protein